MTDLCLHCAVIKTIQEWARQYGEKSGNKVGLDVRYVLDAMARVAADITGEVPEHQTHAIKALHIAIDNAVRAGRGQIH